MRFLLKKIKDTAYLFVFFGIISCGDLDILNLASEDSEVPVSTEQEENLTKVLEEAASDQKPKIILEKFSGNCPAICETKITVSSYGGKRFSWKLIYV